MEDQIKLAFIKEVLEKHGEKIVADIQEGIRYNQYSGTGYMEKSVGMSVDRSRNSEGTLKIEGQLYMRFQDITASHKNRRDKKEKRKRRKIKDNQFSGSRKGFYTKSIYKNLSPIIWELSYGLTEEVRENIRQTFNQNS